MKRVPFFARGAGSDVRKGMKTRGIETNRIAG
jgi:hypothetical protein